MALTFTRAATAELKRRIQMELGENADPPAVSTLHSFALRTILRHGAATHLPQPVRIADDYEERWIIEEELKQILDLARVDEARDLLRQLSADWEQLTPGWEARFPNPPFLGAWREHREIYGYTLRAELVYQLKLALEEEEIERHDAASHVLIDEYQDLNACDMAVVRHLAAIGAELYVAGDDDQSIYGFRYANPDGIRRFDQEYEPSASLQLAECRRCDRAILGLGMYVAEQDPRRVGKELRPTDDAGQGEVQILRFRNQREEARGISRICNWLVNNQGLEPEQILILLRTDRNRQFSSPIRAALESLELPVITVADPLRPLEEPEGRHFLCLLRLVANTNDHLAWRTILEVRRNGIGENAFHALYELARQNGQRFSDAINAVSANPSLISRFGSRIRREVISIREAVQTAAAQEIDDLAAFIRSMADSHISDAEDRDQVMSVFDRVLSGAEIDDLEQFLRAINVSLNGAEQDTEEDHINIMTMHQAKGLSADAVILAAPEDEYVPGRAEGEALNDERRLLYVSLTRARHYLFVTYCRRRTGAQMHSGRTSGTATRTLTRFLTGGPIPSRGGDEYIAGLYE
jgi:DNA helicase-2/ATP-dependent DNA helicase PcrA